MKKGFTLIELLAVIIILAVVALVATPIILDVIDTARSEANRQTINGIITAGEYYYSESLLDDNKKSQMNGTTDIYSSITVSGEKPEQGNLFVNEQGQVALLVIIKDKCYKKNFNSETEELTNEDEGCEVTTIINDKTPPTITLNIEGIKGNNNWYTSHVYVNISASDEGSGVKEYSWCSTTNEECSLTNIETNNKKIELLNGYKLCAQATDKSENSSEIICTGIFNIDTVSPEISGIADITVSKDEIVDLTKDIELEDLLSGIETYTYNPKSIDTSKAGTTEVIYTVYDKAGNKREVTRKIFVETSVPTVEFKVEDGIINENGWAKEDFYVTVKVTDNSGHGIKEFNICTITGNDECDPTKGTTIPKDTKDSISNYKCPKGVEADYCATREIITESNNNRICVQATDNYNQTSEIICSDAYKLDKTNATLELDKYTYIEGFKGWTYSSDSYEQDGIVYLQKEVGSTAFLPYYAVNNSYWSIEYDAYVNNETEEYNSGSAYGHVNYFDEEFNLIVVENGYLGNGYAKQFEINNWYHVTFNAIAINMKYIKWYLKTHEVYSTGPVQIKNFKIKGQLYQDFYNITLSTTDTNSIEIVKYALGEKGESYFENNGIIVTTNEITVTENGTYTFYVKDIAGNVTIDTVVIDKIDKESPIITDKSETNKVKLGASNDIASTYFDINQNGIAAITQTTCINKTDNSIVANTSSLTAGTHEIECTILKANNKEAKATTNIEIYYDFVYTGTIQSFTVSKTGTYKIELYGAQGGASLREGIEQDIGGNGGYTLGNISLNQGQILYIVVGGKGGTGSLTECSLGGYNGGGTGSNDGLINDCGPANDDEASGGGGGATHVATEIGLLSSLETNKSAILMVAGGGGGASYVYPGGTGGGLIGGTRENTSQNTVNQITGYAFGQGENGIGSAASDGVAGGGGGYYGGYANNVDTVSAGSGGSGYVRSSINGITISGSEAIPTHDGMSTMIGNTGDGYVKITPIN